MNNYLIIWNGMFFTGTAWNIYLEEGKRFYNPRDAVLIASGYVGAQVIKNYRHPTQEVVFPY